MAFLRCTARALCMDVECPRVPPSLPRGLDLLLPSVPSSCPLAYAAKQHQLASPCIQALHGRLVSCTLQRLKSCCPIPPSALSCLVATRLANYGVFLAPGECTVLSVPGSPSLFLLPNTSSLFGAQFYAEARRQKVH